MYNCLSFVIKSLCVCGVMFFLIYRLGEFLFFLDLIKILFFFGKNCEDNFEVYDGRIWFFEYLEGNWVIYIGVLCKG